MSARSISKVCGAPGCGVQVATGQLVSDIVVEEIRLDDSVVAAQALANNMTPYRWQSATVTHTVKDGEVIHVIE